MKTQKNKTVLAVALTLATALLSACNTIEGAGRDVGAAGEGISNAARATGAAISGEKPAESK